MEIIEICSRCQPILGERGVLLHRNSHLVLNGQKAHQPVTWTWSLRHLDHSGHAYRALCYGKTGGKNAAPI